MDLSTTEIISWLDEEFFSTGSMVSFEDRGVTFLSKGGTLENITSIKSSNSPLIYLKDFYSDHYLTYSPRKTLSIQTNVLRDLAHSLQLIKPRFTQISNDDSLYEIDFNKLKNNFSHELLKVVLISRENYQTPRTAETLKYLFFKAFSFGAGIPYGIWSHDFGIMGSTPELLFSLKNNHLKTFALAATAQQGQEQYLLNSKKDQKEHELVVQDIMEKLSPMGVNTKRSLTYISPYKSLIHLKTDIETYVKENLPIHDIISALSPTAALGGYPKAEAMKFLKSTAYFHNHPQRFFGAPFGVIGSDETNFLVAIRNIQWDKEHFFIESGGGIVQESEFNDEIKEIKLKRNTIKNHYL